MLRFGAIMNEDKNYNVQRNKYRLAYQRIFWTAVVLVQL